MFQPPSQGLLLAQQQQQQQAQQLNPNLPELTFNPASPGVFPGSQALPTFSTILRETTAQIAQQQTAAAAMGMDVSFGTSNSVPAFSLLHSLVYVMVSQIRAHCTPNSVPAFPFLNPLPFMLSCSLGVWRSIVGGSQALFALPF